MSPVCSQQPLLPAASSGCGSTAACWGGKRKAVARAAAGGGCEGGPSLPRACLLSPLATGDLLPPHPTHRLRRGRALLPACLPAREGGGLQERLVGEGAGGCHGCLPQWVPTKRETMQRGRAQRGAVCAAAPCQHLGPELLFPTRLPPPELSATPPASRPARNSAGAAAQARTSATAWRGSACPRPNAPHKTRRRASQTTVHSQAGRSVRWSSLMSTRATW